jgi:hypothetical protein
MFCGVLISGKTRETGVVADETEVVSLSQGVYRVVGLCLCLWWWRDRDGNWALTDEPLGGDAGQVSEVLDLGLELMDFVGVVGFEFEQDFLSWKGGGFIRWFQSQSSGVRSRRRGVFSDDVAQAWLTDVDQEVGSLDFCWSWGYDFELRWESEPEVICCRARSKCELSSW